MEINPGFDSGQYVCITCRSKAIHFA